MGCEIFISHSSKDRTAVETIRAQAEAVGVTPYLYEHDLQPGSHLADKLKAAIARCDALVVLLTNNGAASPNVQQEIGIALALGRPVIPLVAEGVGTDALAMLNGVEYVRFDTTAPQEALTALTAKLHQMAQVRRDQSARATEDERRLQQQELMMALAVVGLLVLLAMSAKSG